MLAVITKSINCQKQMVRKCTQAVNEMTPFKYVPFTAIIYTVGASMYLEVLICILYVQMCTFCRGNAIVTSWAHF